MTGNGQAFASEVLTITDTPVSLSKTKYLPLDTVPAGLRLGANEAFVTVETESIRVTFDGTTPDDGNKVGHIIPVGTGFNIYNLGNISKFKAVRVGGTNASIQVTYFKS